MAFAHRVDGAKWRSRQVAPPDRRTEEELPTRSHVVPQSLQGEGPCDVAGRPQHRHHLAEHPHRSAACVAHSTSSGPQSSRTSIGSGLLRHHEGLERFRRIRHQQELAITDRRVVGAPRGYRRAIQTVRYDDHALAERESVLNEPDNFLADRAIVGVNVDSVVVRRGVTHLSFARSTIIHAPHRYQF